MLGELRTFVPFPPTIRDETHYVGWLSVCPAGVCALTLISSDVIYPYLVERF